MHAAVAVLLGMFVVTADATPETTQSGVPSRVRRPVVTAVEQRPAYEPATASSTVESRRESVTFTRPTVPPMEVQARLVRLPKDTSTSRVVTNLEANEMLQASAEPRRVVVRRSAKVTPVDPIDLPTPEFKEPAEQATNATVEPLPAVVSLHAEEEGGVVLTARRQSVTVEAADPVAPRELVRTPVANSVHPRAISTVQASQVQIEPADTTIEVDTGFNALSAHHGSVYDYTGYLLNGEQGYPFTIHQQPPRLNRKGNVPLCRSTCNLRQHVEYFPYAHGNYYFRPYTFTRLLQQQEQAARMGIDPRNPYSNRQYLKVYEIMEERVRVEEIPLGEIPGEIEGIEGIELQPEPTTDEE